VLAPEATGLLALRARDGDAAAREALVERLAALIAALAGRFERLVPRADLEQAGMVGVLAAVRGVEPDRAGSFEPYAARFAIGEMLACVRQAASPVSVPRSVREAARAVEAAIAEAQARGAPSPTIAELARTTRLDEERVVEALQLRRALHPVPADDAAVEDVPDEHRAIELADERLDLGAHLAALDVRSRRILALRFGLGLTQSEIAEQVGISQMHVSRLLRAALHQLEEGFDGAPGGPSVEPVA
jgi:RNA polymerase sigma-B factor